MISGLELDEGGFGDEDVAGAAAFEWAAGKLADLRVGEVGVFEVLRQHAMGVEEAAVDGDAVLLHARPGLGVGVHGGDGALELVVEAVGLGGFGLAVFDGPAGGVLGAAFDPPAVEDGERGDTVECGLHAGGAGGLIGAAGSVDPDVDALSEQRA